MAIIATEHVRNLGAGLAHSEAILVDRHGLVYGCSAAGFLYRVAPDGAVETVATLPARDFPAWLAADANRSRGEFVLVLHAAPTVASDDGLPAEALRTLRVLVRDLPLKQAAALAAELTGESRKALYQQALEWKQDAAGDDEADADEAR